AEAAPFLYALPNAPATNADVHTRIENAKAIALRAASWSPHDARVWLVIAALNAHSTQASSAAVEALKLSYYTGPNEFALTPLRLLVAGRVAQDEDLQNLVQAEVQRVLLKRSDLKAAITTAYKAASPSSQKIFENAVRDSDPNFLKALQTQP